jgi:ubiquinone/menaquinone biosynthesis C-methylase UbiE
MLAYARAQARASTLDERVEFRMMDALRVLEFPNGFFDLVNQRSGLSWLRTWEWTKILIEYQRVCRPGGIIRITEPDIGGASNSPALTKLNTLTLEAFYHSGRLFASGRDGVIRELERLMIQHGIENVQCRAHTLVYKAGTIECQYACEDAALWFRVGLPFLQKWTNVPSNYQELCQQALKEMRGPGFIATMTLLTVWGTRSTDGKSMLIRGLR